MKKPRVVERIDVFNALETQRILILGQHDISMSPFWAGVVSGLELASNLIEGIDDYEEEE